MSANPLFANRRPLRVAVHASDVDGIVCAALVLMKAPSSKIDFLNVGEALRTEESYDLVVDLPKTKNCSANVDHHLSNYERLVAEGLLGDDDMVDPSAPSAATLLVRFLGLENNPRAMRLVEMAEIADTGGYSPETYVLDRIIKCNSRSPEKLLRIAWALVERGTEFLKDDFMAEEWRRIKPWLDFGVREARKITEKAQGLDMLIVELVRGFPRIAISDLQHGFLHGGGKLIIVVNRMRDVDPVCPDMPVNHSIARFSIRASDASEVSAKEIAEMLGGGGHPKAAGARISDAEYPWALLKVLESLSKHGIVGYIRYER